MIAGTVVSGLVLGTASVLIEMPGGVAPEADTVEVTPGSGFDLKRDDREAALPEVQGGPESGGVSQIVPPVPDDLASLGGADTAPARQPETGTADGLAEAPAATSESAGVEVESESPVLPSPQVPAPAVPEGEGRVSVSTDPAQPPAPDTGEENAGLTAPDDTAPQTESQELPTQEDARSAVPVFPEEEPAPVPLPETTGDAGSIEPVAPDEGAVAPSEAEPDTTGDEQAKTLPPSGTIDDRAEGVTTSRLPRIGEAEPDAEESADVSAPQGALERNSVSFENPDDKPLMAIILMDDGQSPIGLEAVQSFPYPLSFAVDVDWPGAAEAAARYRDAGFEVLAMADLPEGARAEDTEVAMQAWLDQVPQAVAVLEGTGNGLQSSREASAQLAPILKESGHGLVMHSNGLNTAQKLIAREGVPSASLFRDFDGDGQNAAAIRRFLDQAAMRAGQQEEGVIMLGRLRADTISALLLWGLQDRATSVALAPVSAVLTQTSE